MNTLPADWKKRSKEHTKAYRRMLEKGPKNKILAALPSLHKRAFVTIDCLQCAACCKNYSPRFKQPDIKRLAKRLKIKEGELVARYLYLDKENDYVVQSSPCPFLGEDNACSVYEDRPSDCRRFPYTDEDVVLKRVPLTLTNAGFCPITFYVLENLRERLG